MSRPKEGVNEDEEIVYFDTLYNFAQVAISANDMALNGYAPKQIAKKLQQSAEAFLLLCKTENVVPEKVKKPGRPKKAEVEPEQPKEPEPEPLPENFARDENGWLLCPVCRKKLLKLTSTTKIVNCPVYCKSCKTEYLMSWWNIENKEIAYTRYVNNKHFIDRKDICNSGMQRTGVSEFIRTHTSATERVAINL